MLLENLKRGLAAALCACLLLSLLPAGALAGELPTGGGAGEHGNEVYSIEMTVTVDGTACEKKGKSGMEDALEGVTLSNITALEISAGALTDADWSWFLGNEGFTSLETFTAAGMDGVADLPACAQGAGFPASVKCVSLPQISAIGDGVFYACTGLTSLTLGGTPPELGSGVFADPPAGGARTVSLADEGGTVLTGTRLENAVAAYRKTGAWSAWTLPEVPDNAITCSNASLFANGRAITLAAGGTVNGVPYTKVYYSDDLTTPIDLKNVYPSITGDMERGYQLSAYSVYGGGAAETENTHITMTGGSVKALLGGGSSGAVTGTAVIDCSGGTADAIYGGGKGGVNRAEINLSGGATVNGWVYWGGSSNRANAPGTALGTTIRLSGGAICGTAMQPGGINLNKYDMSNPENADVRLVLSGNPQFTGDSYCSIETTGGEDQIYIGGPVTDGKSAAQKLPWRNKVTGEGIVAAKGTDDYTITRDDLFQLQSYNSGWVLMLDTEHNQLVEHRNDATGAFASFSLAGQQGGIIKRAKDGKININVTVPKGTDLTALAASFTLSGTSAGATVEVDGAVQDSGVTVNDFSRPVTYQLTTRYGTAGKTYTVNVHTAPWDGAGTGADPYRIRTQADLQALAREVSGSEGSGYLGAGNLEMLFPGTYFRLENDIALTGGLDTIGVLRRAAEYDDDNPCFSGFFDGGGHTISGLTQSLFGMVGPGAVIENLGVEGACVLSGSSQYPSLLVWQLSGTVRGCYAAGSISGSKGQVGGLVGTLKAGGRAEHCYTDVRLGLTSSGSGGFVYSALAGSTIESCYAAGAAGEKNYGFISSAAGELTNCYWNTDATAAGAGAETAGLTGKTAAELRAAAFLTALNAGGTAFQAGFAGGFPALAWQSARPSITLSAEDAGGEKTLSGAGLADALKGADRDTLTALTVTAGAMTADDWATLAALPALERFTAASADITDIPDGAGRVFPERLAYARLMHVTYVGSHAFDGCGSLFQAYLPAVRALGQAAFKDCVSLGWLTLGITPPAVEDGAFSNVTAPGRRLEFVYADGSTVLYSSLDYTGAVASYLNTPGSDKARAQWYGFAVPLKPEDPDPEVEYGIKVMNTEGGSAKALTRTAAEGAFVTVLADPRPGYRFKAWSSDSGGVVFADPLADCTSFVMPGHDVTLLASFEPAPGGEIRVTGVHLEPDSLSLYHNASPSAARLTAVVSPAGAADPSVRWQSSNPAVAAVDGRGNVSAVSAGEAVITATTNDGGYAAGCSVTVRAYGGGSSSGRGEAPAPAVPEKPSTVGDTTTVTTPVKPVTDGAAASASISGQVMADAIGSAVNAARENGTSANVELRVETPAGIVQVRTAVPAACVGALAERGASLTVSTGLGSVTLDSAALAFLAAKAGAEQVTLSIAAVDGAGLTPAQQAAVGGGLVVDLSVTAGRAAISSFEGGAARVAVPYALREGEEAGGVVIRYLDGGGALTRVPGGYDAETGLATFETGHFSKYVISYDPAAAWANPFSDLDGDAWYYGAVCAGVSGGLFNGTTGHTFSPDAPMTRAMLWTVLARMEGVDTASGGTWYAAGAAWAAGAGLTDGSAPEAPVTRGELAGVLFRLAGSPGEQDAWAWAGDLALFPAGGGPEGVATRAEAAAALQRCRAQAR